MTKTERRVVVIVSRALCVPSLIAAALYLSLNAAGIGWCGALCFGIGSAGSSFSVSSAFGGGEVMFFLEMLGMLASVAALLTAVGGLVTIWAGPAPARAAALAPGLAAGGEPVVVLRGPADGIL